MRVSRLLVVGTVPLDPGRVFEGEVEPAGDDLLVGGERVPGCQGTTAMLAAALAATKHLGAPAPVAVLGGDIGKGDGTRAAYAAIRAAGQRWQPSVVAFHYLQPVMALMRDAVSTLTQGTNGDAPLLVADAGGMYAARAAGLARSFELMTPDIGEIGFLADEKASHPAYVSHYLFGREEFDPDALAELAWRTGGCARVTLIKGATDRVAVEGRIVAAVDAPMVPTLEAIGGTGDTLTGLGAGLMSGGMSASDAALLAARTNRRGGELLGARPDHRAIDLVKHFPAALAETPAT